MEKRLGATEEALKQKPEPMKSEEQEAGSTEQCTQNEKPEKSDEEKTPKPETLTRENLIKIADAVIKVKTKDIRKTIRDALRYHLGIVD